MQVSWSLNAQADVLRIADFYERFDSDYAAKMVAFIRSAVSLPARFPFAGRPCDGFQPREVRDLVAGEFQLRYEVLETQIRILRVWHSKESR